MIKLILITSAMILLMGVLFPGDWGLMIPIWIYVFVYQFPLRVRSDLPRPISRSYLSHANLWCVFSETAIFILVVSALLELFVLTPLPAITLSKQLTLVYQTPTQWHLWLAGTVCWLPWVQYLRRRYGFKVRQYVLIMATAYLVTAGTVWTLSRGDGQPQRRTSGERDNRQLPIEYGLTCFAVAQGLPESRPNVQRLLSIQSHLLKGGTS